LRKNKELNELFETPLITTMMKINRLRWLGDIERMDDNRQTKNVDTKGMEGKRQRGRKFKEFYPIFKPNLGITN
jgi:hypothetical protein